MPRKGYLAEGVPVMLTGIGGPGAPHQFTFERRETLGFWDVARRRLYILNLVLD